MKQLYSFILDKRPNLDSPNKGEFYAYSIILNKDNVNILPRDMFSNSLVKTAIKVAEAISTNNYFTYFKILKEVPYVMKCLMHSFSFEIRKNAIRVMKETSKEEIRPNDLKEKLHFNSADEAKNFAKIFIKTGDGILRKNSHFDDVKDITLYRIPEFIREIKPGRDLQSKVYRIENNALTTSTSSFSFSQILEPHQRSSQSSMIFSIPQPPVSIAPQLQSSQPQTVNQEELRLKQEKERQEQEEKERREKEEREKREKEERERKERQEREERERREQEENERKEKEEREKREKEERERRERQEREERERKAQEELRLRKLAEEKKKKAMDINAAINSLDELDFAKILDSVQDKDFKAWKITVIFHNNISKDDYLGRILNKKLSVLSNIPNIDFNKLWGIDSVSERDLHCAQTVILIGESWNNETLNDYISRLTYVNAEVLVFYPNRTDIPTTFNRKVVPHKIPPIPQKDSMPSVREFDAVITKDLESAITDSLRRSFGYFKKVGLERTTLYNYIKLRFNDLTHVKMSTEHIQLWNNPDFFRERTNAFVSLIENDVIKSVQQLNLLKFSEEQFIKKVTSALSKLRMPEFQWNDLLKRYSQNLNSAFAEEATKLFKSFVTKLNIKGVDAFTDNFKRFLYSVISNRNLSMNPVQVLSWRMNWNEIFNDLVTKIIEEVIKPKDFEIVVNGSKGADKYKSIDDQYRNRVKIFASRQLEVEKRRAESEEENRDENVYSQPPAHKKRKSGKVAKPLKIGTEMKPSRIIKYDVSKEKEQWESDFEKILSLK